MGNSPDSKTPAFAALALIVLGILIAAVQGFTHGSIAGGVIAQWVGLPSMFRMVVALMLAVALVIGKVMPRLRSVQADLAVPLGVHEARQEG
jgi:predicted MFS family arabinose efflux permease